MSSTLHNTEAIPFSVEEPRQPETIWPKPATPPLSYHLSTFRAISRTMPFKPLANGTSSEVCAYSLVVYASSEERTRGLYFPASKGNEAKFPNVPGVDGDNGTVLPVSPSPPPTSAPTPVVVPGERRPSTVSWAAMTRPASEKSSGVKTIPRSSPSWELDAVSTGADRAAVSASLTTDEVDDVVLVTCFGVVIENKPILCYR